MDEKILNDLLKAYSDASAASIALTAQITALSDKQKEVDRLLSTIKESITELGAKVEKGISERENEIIAANNSFSLRADSIEEHLKEEKLLAGKNAESIEMLRRNTDKRFFNIEERLAILENS